jgi:hypothetical protein
LKFDQAALRFVHFNFERNVPIEFTVLHYTSQVTFFVLKKEIGLAFSATKASSFSKTPYFKEIIRRSAMAIAYISDAQLIANFIDTLAFTRWQVSQNSDGNGQENKLGHWHELNEMTQHLRKNDVTVDASDYHKYHLYD